MTEVYKVVRQEEGLYYSALCHGRYTAAYAVEKDTIPVLGYLYAFANLSAAAAFMDVNAVYKLDRWTIFRADADIVDECALVSILPEFDERSYAVFWGTPNEWEDIGCIAPTGSVWCSRIRLLEEVNANQV